MVLGLLFDLQGTVVNVAVALLASGTTRRLRANAGAVSLLQRLTGARQQTGHADRRNGWKLRTGRLQGAAVLTPWPRGPRPATRSPHGEAGGAGSAWPIARLIEGKRSRSARSTSSTLSCTSATLSAGSTRQ